MPYSQLAIANLLYCKYITFFIICQLYFLFIFNYLFFIELLPYYMRRENYSYQAELQAVSMSWLTFQADPG